MAKSPARPTKLSLHSAHDEVNKRLGEYASTREHPQSPVGVEHQVVEGDKLLQLVAEVVLKLGRPTKAAGVALQVASKGRLVIGVIIVEYVGFSPPTDASGEAKTPA